LETFDATVLGIFRFASIPRAGDTGSGGGTAVFWAASIGIRFPGSLLILLFL